MHDRASLSQLARGWLSPTSSHRELVPKALTRSFSQPPAPRAATAAEMPHTQSMLSNFSTTCSTPATELLSPRRTGVPSHRTKARLPERQPVRLLAKFREEIILDDGAITDRMRSERVRFARARERHQRWLRQVLTSLVDSYEANFDQSSKLETKLCMRTETLSRQRRAAGDAVQVSREIREQRVALNGRRVEELAQQRRQAGVAKRQKEKAKSTPLEEWSSEKQQHSRLTCGMHDCSVEALDIMKGAIAQQQSVGNYNIKVLRDLVDEMVGA